MKIIFNVKHTMRYTLKVFSMTTIKTCHSHETVFMQLQQPNGNTGQKNLCGFVFFFLMLIL